MGKNLLEVHSGEEITLFAQWLAQSEMPVSWIASAGYAAMIASRLVLSVNTVKRHVYNLCGKLGVQSRSQAIVRTSVLTLL